MAERQPHAALHGNREDARRLLEERIQAADSIIAGPIASHDDLSNAQERERNLRAHNGDLLSRMFTTDQYVNEYDGARTPVHQVGDHYDHPSVNALASRLTASVNKQKSRLKSIIERLELIALAATSYWDHSKIFVVHGHDEGAREGVARFIEKIGLTAIILREQPNRGRTLIEKFVDHAREVGFAVVLLTPDDLGGAAADEAQKSRARQNVVFELGYFVGSLGRGRACLLRKGDVEIPSDLYGVVYTTMDSGNGWKIELARELKDAGFEFDADKVLA
jgi:predicted nucleotide-binding protein